MNKEELLLKNFSVLKKNIKKNYEPITAIIKQLLEINPSIGLRCWENSIKDNISFSIIFKSGLIVNLSFIFSIMIK